MSQLRPPTRRFDYVREGDEIYRRSFATIRSEAGLDAMDPALATVTARIIHAAGDVEVARQVAAHPGVVTAARRALAAGAAVLTDSHMVASGVARRRLPADNPVVCTLRDERVPVLARDWDTTQSAAAVSLWLPHLQGAVVAVGNAPTALFHLLEIILDGGPRPAVVVGMPVGFIGSAESKVALAEHALPDGTQIPWIVVHGRRGGSAMAAATVNALATEREIA